LNYSKEQLNNTVKVWQSYSKGMLTPEDGREITKNMVSLVRLLIQLDKKYSACDPK